MYIISHHTYSEEPYSEWPYLLTELTKEGLSLVHDLTHGQNGCHFTDDIFRCIFVNEKFCILVKIALKFVPKGPIDSNPALV